MARKLTGPTPLCRHCTWRKANGSRGLCTVCCSDPDIRVLYKPLPRVGRGGLKASLADRNGMPLAKESTRALPGTPEKAKVLQERWCRGECLWHPDDAVERGLQAMADENEKAAEFARINVPLIDFERFVADAGRGRIAAGDRTGIQETVASLRKAVVNLYDHCEQKLKDKDEEIAQLRARIDALSDPRCDLDCDACRAE